MDGVEKIVKNIFVGLHTGDALTHKTNTGTIKGRRLLIATQLDQTNHLANQQQVLGFAMPFASLSIL
jgi:hypothetical protein